MRWRIYYGDGSVYSEQDGSPFEAPTTNVQVIAQSDTSSATGRILIHTRLTGEGYYCWRDDGYGWDNHDQAGFFDYLFNYRGPKAVIFGRTILTEKYLAIVGRAAAEGLGDG